MFSKFKNTTQYSEIHRPEISSGYFEWHWMDPILLLWPIHFIVKLWNSWEREREKTHKEPCYCNNKLHCTLKDHKQCLTQRTTLSSSHRHVMCSLASYQDIHCTVCGTSQKVQAQFREWNWSAFYKHRCLPCCVDCTTSSCTILLALIYLLTFVHLYL